MSSIQMSSESTPDEGYATASTREDPSKTPPIEISPTAFSVEAFIKQRCVEMLDCLNNGGFREVMAPHVAPHFRGFYEEDGFRLTAQSPEEYFDVVEDMYYHRNPNFHTDLENISIDVNEKEGVAEVYVTRTDVGLADGIRRETTCMQTWQRIEGKWLMSYDRGIRTFPFYTVDEVLGGGGI